MWLWGIGLCTYRMQCSKLCSIIVLDDLRRISNAQEVGVVGSSGHPMDVCKLSAHV